MVRLIWRESGAEGEQRPVEYLPVIGWAVVALYQGVSGLGTRVEPVFVCNGYPATLSGLESVADMEVVEAGAHAGG